MCGIAGFISTNHSKKHLRALEALLIANESRGNHSTGVYFNGLVKKRAVCASKFVADVKLGGIATSKLVLGHTRNATTGEVNNKNAHPFRFGNITGIHNGMVSNYKDVYAKATVDSEAIFHLLHKKNNDVKKVFKKLSGSIACAWTNNDNKLYLVRHNNPLAVAYMDNAIFFSSEYHHLYAVLHAIYGERVQFITELEEDKVFCVSPHLSVVEEKVSFKKNTYSNYQLYKPTANELLGEDIEDYDGMSADMFDDLMTTEGCSMCERYSAMGYLQVQAGEAYCDNCYKLLSSYEQEKCIQIGYSDIRKGGVNYEL